MKGLLPILLAVCGLKGTLAGRAFPVAAENFVTNLFQSINHHLEWDSTNFLIDLSGRFALCKNAGQRGALKVEQRTPTEETIGGLIDFASGSETHAPAVVEYVKYTLPAWVREAQFSEQIKRSEKFGCSVQPGCEGRAVIACLFSPQFSGEGPPPLKQIAQAFTRKQYRTAQRITGVVWDQSHYLENLSGYETDCAMVSQSSWPFNRAIDMARDDGFTVLGLMGKTVNRGSTPAALEEILRRFKQIPSTLVGCSLIPDCKENSRMWVVISCLYRQ